MSTIDRFASRRRDAEPRAEKKVVWVCSECFDVYDATTADGNCPNPGHAPVKLFATRVRSIDAGRAAPRPERRPVRPLGRRRERSKAA
jgi:hypothetical protein